MEGNVRKISHLYLPRWGVADFIDHVTGVSALEGQTPRLRITLLSIQMEFLSFQIFPFKCFVKIVKFQDLF